MNQKQTSKLHNKFRNKFLIFKKPLLLFLAFVLLMPIVITLTNTAKAGASFNFSESGTLSDESKTGNCPVNKMPFKSVIEVNKPQNAGGLLSNSTFTTGINQDLKFYVSMEVTNNTGIRGAVDSVSGGAANFQTIVDNCKAQAEAGKINLRAVIDYKRFTVAGNNPYIAAGQLRTPAVTMTFGNGKLEANLTTKIPTSSLGGAIVGDNSPSSTGDRIIVSFEVTANVGTTWNRNISGTGITGLLQKANVNDESVTQAVNQSKEVGTSTTVDLQDVAKSLTLDSTKDKKGFETVYRYAEDQKDTDSARQGKIQIPFYLSWKGTGSPPLLNSPLIRQQDALFKGALDGFYLGISKEYKNDKSTPQCGSTITDFWCTSLILDQAPKQARELDVQDTLNLSYANISALDTDTAAASTATTKPKLVKKAVALPMVSVKASNDNAVMTNNSSAITIEVYATFEDLKKACQEADANADCSKPENLYYGHKYTEVTTTGAQDSKDTTAKTLIDFLRRVVVDITLLLTGLIYKIFSFILVPVLKALLSIHPYEDKFVDFIYPGWVIIRNLTNIAFIIALLVMGLKVMFRQEGVGNSQGFLVRLILMALLVNFSLVIGQSVVAIADTVQSQFLPENNKVLEVLGQKLMVDPVIIFRDSLNDPNNNFSETPAASDIFKPIVLLVLSIASFFAFVALAGLIFVRIIMLWVLYMVSPFAYFGRLLKETQKYADQWWSEFIKQTMTVPILAFFLNITALMATTFAVRTGSSVTVSPANEYLLGGITGDLATFTITVISHFVVLIFLGAGMVYATSAGGIGSKAVVKYAKKGFDNFTTRPAKWAYNQAKDLGKYGVKQGKLFGKDAANTFYERNIAGGMLDLKKWKDNWKSSVAETTKRRKAERLARNAQKLGPGNLLPKDATSWAELGKNWKQAGKYLAAKIKGRGPDGLLNNANKFQEASQILTDNDRAALMSRYANHVSDKADIDHEKYLLEDHGAITIERATKYKDNLQKMADSADKQAKDLEKGMQKKINNGTIDANGEEATKTKKKIADLRQDAQQYQDGAKNLDAAIGRSQAAGSNEVSLENKNVDLNLVSPVLKVDQLSIDLEDDSKKAAKVIKADKESIDLDDKRREQYGIQHITEDQQKDFRRQSDSYRDEAKSVNMVTSKEGQAALNILKKDAAEKIEKIDDVDGLKEIYKEALAKNNSALAAAIAEKMAKIGGLDDLLKMRGFDNNLKDFQRFIDQEFKNLAPQLRLQLGSQISYIAKGNGNAVLGNATTYEYNKGTGEVVVNWSQEGLASKKLDAKQKSDRPDVASKYKKTDISKEAGGLWYLNQGFVDAMNNWNPAAVDNFVKDAPTSLVKHILDSKGSEQIKTSVKNILSSVV